MIIPISNPYGNFSAQDFITTLTSFLSNPLISSAVIFLLALFLFLLGWAILQESWRG